MCCTSIDGDHVIHQHTGVCIMRSTSIDGFASCAPGDQHRRSETQIGYRSTYRCTSLVFMCIFVSPYLQLMCITYALTHLCAFIYMTSYIRFLERWPWWMLVVLHSLTSTNPTCQRCPSPCHPFCPPMTWWSRSESGTLWLRVSWPQSAAEESTNKKNLQITRQESTNNASQNATCDVIPEVCANIMYSILSPKCGDASSICKTRITYVALIGHPILLTNLSPPIHFPLLRCRRETAVRTDFATAIVCPSVSAVTVMGHTMRCIGSPIVCHGQQSSDKKSERKVFPRSTYCAEVFTSSS